MGGAAAAMWTAPDERASATLTTPAAPGLDAGGQAARPAPLALTDFQPRSMLEVAVTRVERPRAPVIDVHTHLSFTRTDGAMRYAAPPEEVLQIMDRRGVQTMVNLTGGWGEALGLYLRDGGPSGALVKVDDPRFDPMWEACGALGLPVAIHIADPEAFFVTTDRFNERYEELANHPDWAFNTPGFPSFLELLAACDRVFARHPKTNFIALHVGHNAENLARVSERLDRHPNMSVELGARIGELGRQPRTAKRFIDKYQDRVLFGTDAIPYGAETPQQIFNDDLYRIYYRFLETEDEYFDYAPAPIPPQGRWRIYGLGLAEPVLRKVYHDNAARLLKVDR
jgi:predicted TIM-barrel fold metal-dependent hydrolase